MDHLVIDIFNNDKRLKARAMHMVTSFGRWESREGVLELLRQGRHVILQSYAFTDVALSLYADVPIEWVLIPDKGLPRPDVVFQIVKDYKELDEEEKKLQDKYRLFHGYRYWKTFSESEDLAENIVDYVKNIIKEYEKTSMDNFARNFYPDSIGEDLFMYNEV